ncbi:mitochondrial inner membrane protein OXA1L-like isoform X2 [Tubulanus polymorphus]|uniref:mitochondrial inner membrane protein OXA1L-like isoform X2 n=1 Tax=Tubulanus polymorphus TaxID=672921 RepID=UPI003DA60292
MAASIVQFAVHVAGRRLCLTYTGNTTRIYQSIHRNIQHSSVRRFSAPSRCQPILPVQHSVVSSIRLFDKPRQSSVIYGAFIRYNSNETATAAAGTTDGTSPVEQTYTDAYIPEPPPVPDAAAAAVDGLPESAQLVLNSLGEPAITSLGLGCWYTPAGVVQLALESLHVTCDLPWWAAIVAGTLFVRCCMFPLVILAQRNSARLHNHMPGMTRLQDAFSEARLTNNQLEVARAGNELMTYMSKHRIQPFKNMLVPMAQVPVFLSVFMGLRKMANLPVASMTTGGILWFTDLTLADNWYGMPLITMATFLLTIEVGVDGVRASSQTHAMKWILRAMPIFILPMISNFPAAMLVYWLTSNMFSLTQVVFLKIPKVRSFFKIEPLVKHAPGVQKKKKFIQGFKETWNNSKTMASVEDRMRADEKAFRQAGIGPIQKTFKHDPTKVVKKKK